jgi:ABC-type transporter Mla MlaB component
MHVCWGFDDDVAFRRAAGAFLAEGHERGDRLLYVADAGVAEMREHLSGLDVERLVHDGGLLLRPVGELRRPGRAFDWRRQIETYRALAHAAVEDGYRGLRLAAEATSLVTTAAARRAFVDYELAVDRLISQEPIAALCAYHETTLGPALEELVAVHPTRHGTASAACQAYYDGDVLHIAGEVDLSTATVFEAALAVLHSDTGVSRVDLAELRFIDVASLVRFSEVADALAGSGRRLRLLNAPAFLRRCVDILGLSPLAHGFDVR